MSGPLHTYKRFLAYFICCGWTYGCHSTLYGHRQDWAVCRIWELTTLLGCDWYLLSTSYTCQVHFIRINGFCILYMQWMVIRLQPQPVWPWPGPGSSRVSHLGTNHTVRLWLGTCIHFIHLSGPLHTYKKWAWHTLYAVDGHMDATPPCMDIARTGLCVTSGNSPHS
jgi:hypothetical protein